MLETNSVPTELIGAGVGSGTHVSGHDFCARRTNRKENIDDQLFETIRLRAVPNQTSVLVNAIPLCVFGGIVAVWSSYELAIFFWALVPFCFILNYWQLNRPRSNCLLTGNFFKPVNFDSQIPWTKIEKLELQWGGHFVVHWQEGDKPQKYIFSLSDFVPQDQLLALTVFRKLAVAEDAKYWQRKYSQLESTLLVESSNSKECQQLDSSAGNYLDSNLGWLEKLTSSPIGLILEGVFLPFILLAIFSSITHRKTQLRLAAASFLSLVLNVRMFWGQWLQPVSMISIACISCLAIFGYFLGRTNSEPMRKPLVLTEVTLMGIVLVFPAIINLVAIEWIPDSWVRSVTLSVLGVSLLPFLFAAWLSKQQTDQADQTHQTALPRTSKPQLDVEASIEKCDSELNQRYPWLKTVGKRYR